MLRRYFPLLVVIAIVLLIVLTSLFTVQEPQVAIRTEFGAIVGIDYDPGLHWKWPWDQVVKFERRILSQSYEGETFLTNDNRGLIVDFYVKWRVNDASRFFQATGGVEDIAAERLEQIVTSERAAVTGDMFGKANHAVAGLGVELIDVRVQRIDLPEDVATRVYDSMKQNFAKIASRLRGEGSSAAVRIRATAERQRTEILADAERDALRVRGQADAEAAQIFARAYASNPDFYAFYRSLQAYDRSLGKDGDLLVISPDGEFFKYFKDSGTAGSPVKPAKR